VFSAIVFHLNQVTLAPSNVLTKRAEGKINVTVQGNMSDVF